MLMRCMPRMMLAPAMGGAMVAPVLGGMALLAGAGPFLLGLGAGAAMVGGALALKKGMKRRDSWRDDGPVTTAGMGGPDPLPGSTDTLPGGLTNPL